MTSGSRSTTTTNAALDLNSVLILFIAGESAGSWRPARLSIKTTFPSSGPISSSSSALGSSLKIAEKGISVASRVKGICSFSKTICFPSITSSSRGESLSISCCSQFAVWK